MTNLLTNAKIVLAIFFIALLSTANVYADYCMAGSNSCTFEYMSNVEFGDIDNDSDCSTNVQDFTNLSTDLKLGQGEKMTVTITDFYDDDNVSVWIDWDQSETWDSDERFDLTTNINDENATGTITIPLNSDAVEGETRMRIRMTWLGTNQPCTASDYGDAEDYTVNIIVPKPDAQMEAIIYPTPVTLGVHTLQARFSSQGADVDLTSCTINWSINGEDQTPVNWSGLLEEDESATVTLGDINISYAPDGPFLPFEVEAWITDVNGDPDSEDITSNNDRSVSLAPPLNDAGITAFTSPSGTIEPGVYDIYVRIHNYAPKPLENVTVEWSVDGLTQTPKAWNGFLRSGESTEFKVGSYEIYVKSPLVPFQFKANTSKPNGITDQLQTNDSYQTGFAVSLIAGDYTIGGSTGTFPTLKACFDYLSASGIVGDGACTFTVASGNYYGPLNFIDFPRGNNTFVFKSATGNRNDVVVMGNGEEGGMYVGKIQGIENVEFHHMSFNTSGVDKVFELDNADNFMLNDVVFRGEQGTSKTVDNSLLHVMNSDEISVMNSYFGNGSYGVYAHGNSGLNIQNTNFFNFESGAITQMGDNQGDGEYGPGEYSEGTTYIHNCVFEAESGVGPDFGVKVKAGATITNNVFRGIGEEENMTGVVIEVSGDSYNENVIMNNEIPLGKNTHGIVVQGNTNTTIDKNNVTVFNYSYYDNVYGIMADGMGGADFKLMNNTIFTTDGVSFYADGANLTVNKNHFNSRSSMNSDLSTIELHNTSGMFGLNMVVAQGVDGMELIASQGLNLMYNSVNSTKSGGTALMLDMGANNIYRNIFANQESDGYVVMAYNQNKNSLVMDENDLFTRNHEQFGMFNGEAVANFVDWQAKSDKDWNSSNVDPMFSQDHILFLTRYDPGLLASEPMGMDMTDEQRDMFENYDWHGDNRLEQQAYYFGIDNIRPEVIIDAHPEETIVCHDDTDAEMYVSARVNLGAQTIYEWYKDGVPIPNSNSPYLRFKDLDYEMSGIYHCRISGTGGAIPVNSKAAAFYVLTEPAITQQPAEMTNAKPGDVVKYHIKAHYRGISEEDANLPLFQHKIQWYKYSSSASGDGIVALTDDEVISGSKSAILTFNGLRDEDFTTDEQYYFAIVTGQCGSVETNPAKIMAEPTVEIATQPMDVEACENTEASFMVEILENGGPTDIAYQWYFNGEAIEDDDNYSGANAATLNIYQITPALEGNYSCLVTAQPNDIEVMTDDAMLTVNLSPFFLEPVEFDVAVEEGEKVELVLPVGGAEPLYFVWTKEGEGVVLEGEGENTYTIEALSSTEEGFYSCIITNECGEIQTTDNFNVAIKDRGISSVVVDNESGVKLLTPVPNPVSGIAEISYEMPHSANTIINLVDDLGRNIAEIYNGTAVQGLNTVTYDFSRIPSGVYFFTLQSNGILVTNKIMIIK